MALSSPGHESKLILLIEDNIDDERLTLVAGDKAIETEVSLDANGQPR